MPLHFPRRWRRCFAGSRGFKDDEQQGAALLPTLDSSGEPLGSSGSLPAGAFQSARQTAARDSRAIALEEARDKLKSAAWLNTIIESLWPQIAKFVEKTLRTEVQPQIQESLPWALKGLHFVTVDLGQSPLKFDQVVATEREYQTAEGTKAGLRMELDLGYKGDIEVTLAVAGVSFGISKVSIIGKLFADIPTLLPQPPFVGGLNLYFANPPTVSLDFVGAAGVLDFALLKNKILSVVSEVIAGMMVLPKRMAVVLEPEVGDVFRYKCPRPEGIVRLQVLEARSLKAADRGGLLGVGGSGAATSDPYALLSLSGQQWRSPTQNKTLAPEWPVGTGTDLVVYDREAQHLSLKVMDEDGQGLCGVGGGDDLLGFIAPEHPKTTIAALLGLGEKTGWARKRDEVPPPPEPRWLELMQENAAGDLVPVKGEDGHTSAVRVLAKWIPLVLDAERVAAIPAAAATDAAKTSSSAKKSSFTANTTTCVLFCGIYGARDVTLPEPEKPETALGAVEENAGKVLGAVENAAEEVGGKMLGMLGLGGADESKKKKEEKEEQAAKEKKQKEEEAAAAAAAAEEEEQKEKPPTASISVLAVTELALGQSAEGAAKGVGNSVSSTTTGYAPLLPPKENTVENVTPATAATVRRLAAAGVEPGAIAKGLELEEEAVRKVLAADEKEDATRANTLTWEEGFVLPVVDPRATRVQFNLNHGGAKDAPPVGTGSYAVTELLKCEENTAVVEVPVYKPAKEGESSGELLAQVRVRLQLLVCESD